MLVLPSLTISTAPTCTLSILWLIGQPQIRKTASPECSGSNIVAAKIKPRARQTRQAYCKQCFPSASLRSNDSDLILTQLPRPVCYTTRPQVRHNHSRRAISIPLDPHLNNIFFINRLQHVNSPVDRQPNLIKPQTTTTPSHTL